MCIRDRGGAGPAPAAVVLQSAAHVVRALHVVGDFVKLRDGDGVDVVPGFGTIPGNVDAAIAAGDDVIGVGRIDPDGVEVGVNGLADTLVEGLAAVLGEREVHAGEPD